MQIAVTSTMVDAIPMQFAPMIPSHIHRNVHARPVTQTPDLTPVSFAQVRAPGQNEYSFNE